MIELLRDAFGEEKLLYILVAELKDSPTTIPTSEVLYTVHKIFSPSAVLFCRKFYFWIKWTAFRNDGKEQETCRLCFVLLHLFCMEGKDNLCGGPFCQRRIQRYIINFVIYLSPLIMLHCSTPVVLFLGKGLGTALMRECAKVVTPCTFARGKAIIFVYHLSVHTKIARSRHMGI